jgi:hypothetical protein
VSGSDLPLRARAALATYPPSFRERYGSELASVVVDTGTDRRVLADLLLASARAWLRPSLPGDPSERVRGRRLATVSTVWVCWCAVFVAGAALLRAIEDPPPVGFDPNTGGWGVAHDAVATALAVGWLLILVVGAPVGLRAVLRQRSVRRAVVPPVLLLALCVLMFVPLQYYAARHWIAAGASAADSDIPLWWALLALAFVLALGVDAVWGTLALAVGLRRAGLDAVRLRWPTAAAVLLVVPMAVVVVLLVVVALAGAHPSAAGSFAPLVYVAVAGLLAVLTVASVSAVRGLRAL